MARPLDAPARDDIVAIQGLRWLAASLVVWVHAEHELEKVAARAHHALRFSRAIEFGIGVDIFFCISGFLICLVSRGQFGRSGAGTDFLKRRVLRIVPLYWLATAAMLGATLAIPSLLNHSVLSPAQAALSFLMIAWPDRQHQVFPLLASGWTLNVEFYFYALFALVVRFRRTLAVGLLLLWFGSSVLVDQVWTTSPWWLNFYAQPIVLEFGCGMLFCMAYERGIRMPAVWAVPGALLAVGLHLGLRDLGHVPRVIGNGVPASLLFLCCVFSAGTAMPRRLADFIRLMGQSSYALYLTSPFAINLAVEVLIRHGVHRVGVLLVASSLFSIVVAVAVFRFVERPLTRSGRRLIDRAGVRASSSAVATEGAIAT